MFIERLVALLLLFAGEFAYLRIADRFNIIDRPNQRSSHKKNVLRGGGIIFLLGVWMYAFLNTTGYPLYVPCLPGFAFSSSLWQCSCYYRKPECL